MVPECLAFWRVQRYFVAVGTLGRRQVVRGIRLQVAAASSAHGSCSGGRESVAWVQMQSSRNRHFLVFSAPASRRQGPQQTRLFPALLSCQAPSIGIRLISPTAVIDSQRSHQTPSAMVGLWVSVPLENFSLRSISPPRSSWSPRRERTPPTPRSIVRTREGRTRREKRQTDGVFYMAVRHPNGA